MIREVREAARKVAQQLAAQNLQLVLAESCTGGLVAATLASIPGISQYLCGSAVVYQTATKQAWLDIPAPPLEKPGPVSREIAERMATQILTRTPQAQLAASITGHLGPHAPPPLDGVVHLAVCYRASEASISMFLHREKLVLEPSTRLRRQHQAAEALLNGLLVAMDQL